MCIKFSLYKNNKEIFNNLSSDFIKNKGLLINLAIAPFDIINQFYRDETITKLIMEPYIISLFKYNEYIFLTVDTKYVNLENKYKDLLKEASD